MRWWQPRHRLAVAALLTVFASAVGARCSPPEQPATTAAPARDAGPGEPGARGGDPGPGDAGREHGDAGRDVGREGRGAGTTYRESETRGIGPSWMGAAVADYAFLTTLEGLILYGGDGLRVAVSTSRDPGPAAVRVVVRVSGKKAVVRTGPSLRAVLLDALATVYDVDGEGNSTVSTRSERERRWRP